jgi:ubiquinone/menaquinone biosynthesis C-methylase UbiE
MNAVSIGMQKYLQSCKSEFWEKVFRAEADYILQQLAGTRDILSVGCGPAIIETGLAEHGFNVTGLDVSKEALDQAPDSIRTVAGPAEEMDFAPQSFDAAIYVASLQFVERHEEAIKQTARVLKPGGRLLVMLLNPESEFFRERTKDPDSYMSKIRHTDLREIEGAVAKYFSVKTEYFLGIEGDEIFESRDSTIASLYIIQGTKKPFICD